MKKIMSVAFIAFVALSACNKKDVTVDAAAQPAVANLSAGFALQNQVPKEGSPVLFSNTSTGAATYKWDFGNGMTSSEKTPTVTYAACGAYDVRLTVTNVKGETKEFADHVIVDCIFRAPGQPPVAHPPLF